MQGPYVTLAMHIRLNNINGIFVKLMHAFVNTSYTTAKKSVNPSCMDPGIFQDKAVELFLKKHYFLGTKNCP